MQYIVRSGALLQFPELVSELGQDPLALLEAAGIESAVLKTPDSYLPYPALARLLNRAAATCRQPDFGVLLAQRQGLHVVGALASQLCLQPSLERALRMIQRHLVFHARGVSVETHEAEGQALLTMDIAFAHRVDCTQLYSLSLGLLARSLDQLCGRALRPVRVEFSQGRPTDTTAFHQLFGRVTGFGQPYNRIVYAASALKLPVQVDAELRKQLNAQWRENLDASAPLSLPQEVQRAIRALLPTGDCCLESVSRTLDLHPRVLQKRLQAQHISFGAILRATRKQLACEHLAHGDIRLTDLALHLGYSELAVFSRHFKRWTGLAPQAWRKRQSEESNIEDIAE